MRRGCLITRSTKGSEEYAVIISSILCLMSNSSLSLSLARTHTQYKRKQGTYGDDATAGLSQTEKDTVQKGSKQLPPAQRSKGDERTASKDGEGSGERHLPPGTPTSFLPPSFHFSDRSLGIVFEHPVAPGSGMGGWLYRQLYRPHHYRFSPGGLGAAGQAGRLIDPQELQHHRSRDDCWIGADLTAIQRE